MLRAGGRPNDRDADKQPPAGNGFPENKGALHTFVSFSSHREEKLIKRAVHATVPPVPQYLNWSEQPIIWSRQDHPELVPCPGKFALVVTPQVKGYVLSKTLMDGGSSINILYYETFKRMKLPENLIQPSSVTFHGIVPGRSATPLGRVVLDVIFGSEENYRLEKIPFEVVNFRSSYHAILGRPAFAKFMAIPNYAYMKMKIRDLTGSSL